MRINSKPYRAADFHACIALFDSNVPKYFAPHERVDFCECLHQVNPISRPYLLLTQNNQVRACGGVIIDIDNKTARMAWGIVDNEFHNQGLGSILTKTRIDLACANPDVCEIGLETSQHTYGFYEKFGFQKIKVTLNGFSDGLDCYEMALKIKPPEM